MYVVLYTSILYSDPFLKGANIVAICNSIELLNGKVCIPEVVKKELINTKNKISKEIKSFNKWIKKNS